MNKQQSGKCKMSEHCLNPSPPVHLNRKLNHSVNTADCRVQKGHGHATENNDTDVCSRIGYRSGPVFMKVLSQGLDLKLRLLSQVSAQNLLRLLS